MINKPINPYPHNCCVDAKKNIYFGYEIPNNEIIDGCYSWVSDLETGVIKDRTPPEYTTPSNGVTYVVNATELANDREYGWQSFYWKTPLDKDAHSYKVTKKDDDGIYIAAKGNYVESVKNDVTYTTDNKRYKAVTNAMHGFDTYDSYIFTSMKDEYSGAHQIGDDTSKYCYQGNLEDYFGYSCMWVGKELFEKLTSMELGKCVIEIYSSASKCVSRARVLAYDEVYAAYFHDYYIIVDNNSIASECSSLKSVNPDGSLSNASKIKVYDHMNLYNTDELNKDANMNGWMMSADGSTYYLVSEFRFSDMDYFLKTTPPFYGDLTFGDTIRFWNRDKADFNLSPTYYFRTKQEPTIAITQSKLKDVNGVNELNDIKCEFGIDYVPAIIDLNYVEYTPTGSNLNYFYLYLYVFNSKSYAWDLQEKSPMFFNGTSSYEFTGLADGQKYKIVGVCVDKDGDEWSAEGLEFVVNKPAILSNTHSSFNENTATIDILLNDVLNSYKTASLEFYKVLKTDADAVIELEYAGGGLAKSDGAVYFDKWSDYNIKNDSYYDYYLRVSYTGKESGTDVGEDLWLVASDVHTDFEGTSILGLEKSNGTQLNIAHNFNLFYHFDNDSADLKNEISREYLNSFGRYPKEIKGNQNYISGSCSGLLGSENNGIYEEPRGIRNKWNNFINDDTIKLYRGIDGETMIISIDSSSVKPYNFSGIGLVNEVRITFKEIASTKQYAIFTTEKMGG